MSLKFAAIGNLMALQALGIHTSREARGRRPLVDMYDPLLALIGRSRDESIVITLRKKRSEGNEEQPRW